MIQVPLYLEAILHSVICQVTYHMMTGTLIQILRESVHTLQAAIKQTLCQGQHLVKQYFQSFSTLKQLDFVKTKLYCSQLQTPNNAKPKKTNSAPDFSLAGIYYQASQLSLHE